MLRMSMCNSLSAWNVIFGRMNYELHREIKETTTVDHRQEKKSILNDLTKSQRDSGENKAIK